MTLTQHALGLPYGYVLSTKIVRDLASGTFDDAQARRSIELATEMGLGVVNAAVFGGGILATGANFSHRYAYREALIPGSADGTPRSDRVDGRGVP